MDHSGSLNVLKLEASEDGKRVYVKADNIQAMDYVINVTLKSIKSAAGKTPWDDWCEYTVNYLSDKIWDAHAVTAIVNTKPVQGRKKEFNYSLNADGSIRISIFELSSFHIVLRDLKGQIIFDKKGYGPSSFMLGKVEQGKPLILTISQSAQTFSKIIVGAVSGEAIHNLSASE